MSSTIKNRSIVLAVRPTGVPGNDCWSEVSGPVQGVAEGEVMVRVIYVSIDPAMRGWITDQASYLSPVAIGGTMRALGIGQVVESRNKDYVEGDYVSGMLGVQDYATLTPDASLLKVDPALAPLPTQLGLLGMPGMTAYFGLLEVGQPKAGETLLVSGAAGAVGALVGQIAKIHGMRVVGVAGGKEKCDFLINNLGFDAAIDYKSEPDLSEAVQRTCPEGINLFFDNVGGDILAAAIKNLAHASRIVICGAISQYNTADTVKAEVDYIPILYSSSSLQGFVVLDYASRYGEAVVALKQWMTDGLVRPHEDIREGLENFPETLNALFTGKHFGKLILKLSASN
ncbi:NADP-dependent oxidoreductase [Maricurvus nonylphenolicus]|uniref:NADP-dependent oxidoreductase n=1 Tax=Maricurvus nonylphenolicus TaxID=1008307 RepID=UPI0036F41901